MTTYQIVDLVSMAWVVLGLLVIAACLFFSGLRDLRDWWRQQLR